MTVSVRVATSPGEARVAVVDDDRLVDFALWRPGSPDGVGDVHRGRVTAMVPAMAGAFVALANEEGFLPDSEGAKGLTAGTILTVRVTRSAQGAKGPRLSTRGIDLVSTEPVGLLRRGPDPVRRFAAIYPDAAILVDDAGAVAGLSRATVVREVFPDAVADSIDALSRPVVELQGGAVISIWPTPALVAIDVDSAQGLAPGTQAGSRHETLNRSVVPLVAEQIRLRNLSGGIVVDLAGLSVRKRAALAPDFAAALARDPLHPKFLGFTALGLAEIVRSRIHPPLHELLAGPLAAGLAALQAALAAFRQDPRGLPAVRAHPAVVSALRTDSVALPDVVRRTGRPVTLRADPSLPDTAWALETDHG